MNWLYTGAGRRKWQYLKNEGHTKRKEMHTPTRSSQKLTFSPFSQIKRNCSPFWFTQCVHKKEKVAIQNTHVSVISSWQPLLSLFCHFSLTRIIIFAIIFIDNLSGDRLLTVMNTN